jgi:hypothetical protein
MVGGVADMGPVTTEIRQIFANEDWHIFDSFYNQKRKSSTVALVDFSPPDPITMPCKYTYQVLSKCTKYATWQPMVARFFLFQTYQNGKNIPNDDKLYQTAIHYAKWP